MRKLIVCKNHEGLMASFYREMSIRSGEKGGHISGTISPGRANLHLVTGSIQWTIEKDFETNSRGWEFDEVEVDPGVSVPPDAVARVKPSWVRKAEVTSPAKAAK